MKKNIVYALTILAVSFSLSACTASQVKINLLEKIGQKVKKVDTKIEQKFQKTENKIDQKIVDEKGETDDQTLEELNTTPSSTIDQNLNQIESDLK